MNTIEYKNIELTISEEMQVLENDVLVLDGCKLYFAPNVGITSLGSIIAINSTFEPLDKKLGWGGVADIGKSRSSFDKCYFIQGRGRVLGEFKDKFISRYFGEIDDIEITQEWSEYSQEEQEEAYNKGTYGGAIVALNCSVKECTFEECRVSQEGGAILATFNVSIEKCRFLRCRSGVDGGAVSILSNGDIKLSHFESCRARDEGGGIMLRDYARVENSIFKRCIASRGGAIASHAKSHISNCAFLRCIATHNGGGVSGKFDAYRLLFYKCIAKNGGGADIETKASLSCSRFHKCKALDEGGGIAAWDSYVEYTHFYNCFARMGTVANIRSTHIKKCVFVKNKVINIYASARSLVDHCTFIENKEQKESAAFELFESRIWVEK